MELITDFTTTTGPHKGWTRYAFVFYDRPWNLLLIDDGEEKTSMIAAQDDSRLQPWPHYNHMKFAGLITPGAAAAIINRIYMAHGYGIAAGVAKQQQMARQVFGL